MDTNKVINSRSLSFLKEFCEKQFPNFTTTGKEDNRSKSTTFELKAEIKRKEQTKIEVSQQEYEQLDPGKRITENEKYFKLSENIIWGYKNDNYADKPQLFEELKTVCVHAKMCVAKIPADAGCRFFIGKYMRKANTRIGPPEDDVALRAIFNFNFDEIYTLNPKYTDSTGKHDSGLTQRQLLIKKDTLEVIGPYSLAKYTITVPSNTTQSKQTTPLRGGNNTTLRPSKYERITLVADFWYQPELIDRLDDMIREFLDEDNNEMNQVMKGIGIKTNHSVNKKINEEKKKLAERTRGLSENNARAEKEFQELVKGMGAESKIDNSFFD